MSPAHAAALPLPDPSPVQIPALLDERQHTEYYADLGVRVQYLHSDVDTLERIANGPATRRGETDLDRT